MIGAKSVLGQECTISSFQHVSIGRECVIADRVMLIDFDHGVVEVERPIRLQGIYKRDVRVGHNVWVGYGASFGGVAGAMFASMQGVVSPESFSLTESILVLCMVVLGGMGNIPGVILGAVLLSVFPELLRAAVIPLQRAVFGEVVLDPEGIRMLLFGFALVLVMIFRPAGLWPSAVRRRELSSAKGAQP